MPITHDFMQAAGLAALGLACLYEALALAALLWWRRPREQGQAPVGPVSVLKPLCGAEPGLYEQLRSFCEQDHPAYEIIFGIRDPADPARAVVERLSAQFPHLPITLVADPHLYGSNYKVSNLINMLTAARHGLLAVSDSDARVGPDYLTRVTAPLADPRVGLVTSLYHAVPAGGLWSRLGAMYINDWYMPCVLLARMFGHRGYVSGQTMCLRRRTLEECGGLAPLADNLAEDHLLGERVRQLGLAVVISSYPVIGVQYEPSLRSMSLHELRWMRTLRALAPRSFRWLFTTFSLPLGIAGLILTRAAAPGEAVTATAGALFGVVAALRLALHCLRPGRRLQARLSDLWLVPVRDLLLCWVWARAFGDARVTWRGHSFTVDPGGMMRRCS